MPHIPIEPQTTDTGLFYSETGRLLIKHRNVIVADMGLPVAVPDNVIMASDGTKMVPRAVTGDIAISAAGLVSAKHAAVMAMHVPSASGINTDGVGGGFAGCDQAADVLTTEAAAAFCKVFDVSAGGGAGVYRNISLASVDDFVQWQVFPNNTQDGDRILFGATKPFFQMVLDLSAVVSTYGGNALTWEYYDGAAWKALTLAYDGTDGTAQDGKRSFGADGSISFVPPTDWAVGTFGGQAAFWIQAKVSTVANLLVLGILNAHRHYICTPVDGFIVPHDCTLTGVAIRDQAATVHTTNDIKLVVANFTAGRHSGVLTFAQDKRNDSWASLSVGCAAGDVLGVLITQEDGANEAGPFTLELTFSHV